MVTLVFTVNAKPKPKTIKKQNPKPKGECEIVYSVAILSEHGYRTQVWVAPDFMVQGGSSFMVFL